MRKKRIFIEKVLTVILLAVFAFTIVPWNLTHAHAPIGLNKSEKHCTHKEHLETSQEKCIICSIHFEKTYDLPVITAYFDVKLPITSHYLQVLRGCYAELISTSLRGPPATV